MGDGISECRDFGSSGFGIRHLRVRQVWISEISGFRGVGILDLRFRDFRNSRFGIWDLMRWGFSFFSCLPFRPMYHEPSYLAVNAHSELGDQAARLELTRQKAVVESGGSWAMASQLDARDGPQRVGRSHMPTCRASRRRENDFAIATPSRVLGKGRLKLRRRCALPEGNETSASHIGR